MTLYDKRKQKPFYLRNDGMPYERPLPNLTLLALAVFCILFAAGMSYVLFWAAK